ncbi:MAG: ABC transporter ATP-binding protein [Bacteroidetes bacterium]|nr:MAG: ABC transporter ATP-binding protein [Bacteroidota bacterium]TAG88938.1 MAG: ABC transporter ATP-binding protein [Bacteroidota bacterium]
MFKTLFRVLSYAHPYTFYSISFFICAFLSTVFGILNLGLLMPLLSILFNNFSQAELLKMTEKIPQFDGDFKYFLHIFNYYFASIVLQYGKMTALQFVGAIIITSVFLSNLFKYLSMLSSESVKNNVTRNLRSVLFNRILDFHIGYVAGQRKGDLMASFMGDSGETEAMMKRIWDFLFRHPVTIFIYLFTLLMISWELTLFTLLIVPVMGGLIAFVGRRLRKMSNKIIKVFADMTITLDESLTSLKVIKSYNATDYFKQKYKNLIKEYVNSNMKMVRTQEAASPFSEVTGVMLVMIILLYGSSLIFADKSSLSASSFIAYIAIFSQLLHPIKEMTTHYTHFQKGAASAERLFKILDAKNEIENIENPYILDEFQDKIEFKNVGFSYGNNAIALENINFEIKKGQTVALVGASGSGKSTLADLTLRFHDVTEGEIIIDGKNIKDIELESLEKQMAIVTQNSILFNDTIFNNIAFGKTNANQNDVENAAKIANAHEYIIQKDKQYQYNIGDRGDLLAGGQKQRLAIARAVFKNAPILILDEATSALDSNSERLVQEALEKLMKNKTSLVIAHRLSTIQKADLILVLDKGKIIERGTHLSLMQNDNGMYKKYVEMQMLLAKE